LKKSQVALDLQLGMARPRGGAELARAREVGKTALLPAEEPVLKLSIGFEVKEGEEA
jgi:hypothetical protein